jgi:hypothetical protein
MLVAAEENGMADEGTSSKAQPTGDTGGYLVIVARHETDLWHYITRHCGEFKGVQILLDRRKRERRQQDQPYEPERRRVERRHPSSIETDPRSRPYVIIPP